MPLDWLAKSRQQAVRLVKNLPGLTACSQQIELENGERYVLRHQNERAKCYGIDYRQEARILAAISSLGLSPQPLYQGEHTTLLSWIEGNSPSEFSPILLKMLAMRLASLHTFDLQAVGCLTTFAMFDLSERCQYFWQQLPAKIQQNLPFSPPFVTISPFMRAICHHDIHLQNLVCYQDGLYLIDWEYASLSDPALEIALFFDGNRLNKQQQAVFLDTYFAKTGFDSTAFINKMAEYAEEVPKLSRLWFLL